MNNLVIPVIAAVLIQLSSLPNTCKVSIEHVERFGFSDRAAVLRCDSRQYRVTGPGSLEGIVQIQDSRQALEYVRLFTVVSSFDVFELDGLVEIAGFGNHRTTRDGRFLVEQKYRPQLEVVFHEPSVIHEERNEVSTFRICRIAVALDGKIYEIEELVDQSGAYSLQRKTAIFDNASKIGILHLGHI
jgi:hypothetical protein